jgi:hypothetical protein
MSGSQAGQEYFETIQVEDQPLPNFLVVEVRDAEGQVRTINVEIERAEVPKLFIGGHRSKRTGEEFYHATTNTDQLRREYKTKETREVQTYQYSTKPTVMKREFGCQMDKTGVVHIDTRKDRIIEGQPYFTSEMWDELRERASLFIQRNVRGWLARRRAAQMREIRDARDRAILEKDEALRRTEEENHKREIERRMHPKTKADFELLYNELEMWRLKETERIKTSTVLTDAEKHTALEQLLNKETKLLQTIDRLKITAHTLNQDERVQKFLGATAKPLLLKRDNGKMCEIIDPFITRAKELMDLYNGLKMGHLSIDERLDVLLHTKWTVKEFDCNLTREIVDLIDREADMLNRGRSETSLVGLRKRLSNLFLQFVETPNFNPEAARFQRVPRQLLESALEFEFAKETA